MTEIPHLNIDELYEKKKEVDTNRVMLYNKLLNGLKVFTILLIQNYLKTFLFV